MADRTIFSEARRLAQRGRSLSQAGEAMAGAKQWLDANPNHPDFVMFATLTEALVQLTLFVTDRQPCD